MNLKVITTYDEFCSLESDWSRLLSSRTDSSVFDTFEWNRLWLKHFQHQYELHCLVITSTPDHLITSILPLVKTSRKFYLVGGLDRDRSLFLVPPTKEDITIFLSYLNIAHKGVNKFLNEDLSERDNTPEGLLSDRGSTKDLYESDRIRSSDVSEEDSSFRGKNLFTPKSFTHLEFRNLPIKEAWNLKWILDDLNVPHKLNQKKEYFISPSTFSLASRTVCNEMERKIRKLKHQGTLTYECVTDPRGHGAYLNFLFEHNESRSLDKKYRQRFVDSHYQDWFREMLASKALLAHPCALLLNDKIIALEIGFRYGNNFSNYSTAFDPAWFRFSPGMIRVPMQSEWAQALGVNELRLGSGEMGYKQAFTDDYNQLAHIVIFKNRFIQWLYTVRAFIRRINPIRPMRPINFYTAIPKAIKSFAKVVFLFTLYLLNLHKLFERANERRIRILCYHKVNDSDTSPLAVSVTEFTHQLLFLKRRFIILPLSEIKRLVLGKEPLPANAIAITIDDGYVDNYDIIFPLIKRHSVPISIFIVKEYIEGNLKFPWDGERQPALSKNHIKEMINSGLVEFYPHTATHPLLASLPLEEQRKEIVESKQWIEDLLSTYQSHEASKYRNIEISKYLPNIFAYPSGIPGVDFTEETQKLVREAGFPIAVSVKGYSKQKGLDLYNIERRIALNEPLWMFKLRSAGVIEWVRNLF